MSFFKNIAAAAKTHLENHVRLSLFITINRHLLAIILHNLLDNALKNTSEGIIYIGASNNDGVLSITISDSGNGMDAAIVNHYMALANGNEDPAKQKGMGLHMIIELLAIIEGTIEIKSEINHGTTITLFFKHKG
jgi:sensor histidine kinase regulating citrate/malate metabolism